MEFRMIYDNILLISAARFEAKPSIEILRKNNIKYDYFEFGIGPIHAAKSAEKLKERAKGKNVIYLGSCGTFSDFREPYLATVDQVHWMPTAERMGLAKYMLEIGRAHV